MNQPIYLRIAAEADIPEMHRIRMSVRENQLTDPTKIQPRDTRAMIVERGRGWVAEIGDEVVGFAVADRTRANVWALFVEPGHEGRGVGRQLHEAMMDWFFEEGVERVWLTTEKETRAARFYSLAHWRLVGEAGGGEIRFELTAEQWKARPRAAAEATGAPVARPRTGHRPPTS